MKKNVKWTKDQAQREHAKNRAAERFGINFNKDMRRKFVEMIQKQNYNGCVFLEKQSNRISVYAILHEKTWVPVVYDRHRKNIVSFLPLEFFLDKGITLPNLLTE